MDGPIGVLLEEKLDKVALSVVFLVLIQRIVTAGEDVAEYLSYDTASRRTSHTRLN